MMCKLVRLPLSVFLPSPRFHVKAGKEGRYVTFSFLNERGLSGCVAALIRSGYKVSCFYKA